MTVPHFLTAQQYDQLLQNGIVSVTIGEQDHHPIVRLFTPDAQATWLLSELDPDDNDTAFGLCDLGLGCPELGYVSLAELEAFRGPWGLPIERDLHFQADRPLSTYAETVSANARSGQ